MNHADLLARFLDDEALLAEMVTRLLAAIPPQLDAMRGASADGDSDALHRQAHHLKGSLGMFGPSTAYDTVSRLESMARDGQPRAAARELLVLGTELGQLMNALRRLSSPATDPSARDTV